VTGVSSGSHPGLAVAPGGDLFAFARVGTSVSVTRRHPGSVDWTAPTAMEDDAAVDLSVTDNAFSFAGAYEGPGRLVWAGIVTGESMASDRWSADVGASTGGFTDCLLQHGARKVYAIDVGHGILHRRLRADPRVIAMEKTNARRVSSLPEPIDLATVDASFISLRLLLPVLRGWMRPGADLVALVKPQFEAGRKAVGRGGVVRKAEIHQEVLLGLLPYAAGLGLTPQGLLRSPLLGPKGNVEFLLWCREGAPAVDLNESISSATSRHEP